MAFRTPLKFIVHATDVDQDPIDIAYQNCTAAEITQITTEMIRQYGLNPSATIAYADTGNMGLISNTNLDVGAGVSNTGGSAPSEADTPNVTTFTDNYNKLTGAFHGLNAPTFTRGTEISNATNTAYSFPCYYAGVINGEHTIRQFNLDDMLDTFWHPAATRLVAGGTGDDAAGTYITHTASSLTNHTLLDSRSIYVDTQAEQGAYSADGIPEDAFQRVVRQTYKIFRRNSASAAAMPHLIGQLKDGSQRALPHATLSSQLQAIARYGAINEVDYRIQYKLASSTTGYTTKSTLLDTRLDGSTYLTKQVGDEYRSQEVPSGSSTTITTYNFGIKIS